MKLRLHLLFALVSLSLAGLFVSAGKKNSPGPSISRAAQVHLIHTHCRIDQPLTGQSLAGGTGRSTQADKRHGKSLTSEAILADLFVTAPRWAYRSRKYSLFLPGGFFRQLLSSCSLRGPPFCC